MSDGTKPRPSEQALVIVGADGGLRTVVERAAQVARSNAPVLILGETGSGKELIARAIHAGSRRAGEPFHRVNCGAIPPGLIDSELFGHEKGSFTGATERRRGWFERADGGTLLLDEVGELPLEAQVRLLRVLQDGIFERVGGERHQTVDVRIIAATHRDLPAMVAEHRFREDLWYRLAVFPIRLPALRERPEDIAALAKHLAAKACSRYGTLPIELSERDLALLRAYPWPGNVREMGTVMDRAVILGDGERLEIAKALGVIPSFSLIDPESRADQKGASAKATDLPTLDAVISAHIRLALEQTSGRVEGPRGAAALLDVNPHTLRARMRRLGIDWSVHRPQRARSRG
jgi:transcriptional regulator with GAF, ATPase, and Fis domain